MDVTGKKVADTNTNTVTYERTAMVNLVTGKVTYGDWTAKNGDSILEGNPLPTVENHDIVVTTNNGTVVESDTTTKPVETTIDTKDIVEVVVYAPKAPEEKDTQVAVIRYIEENTEKAVADPDTKTGFAGDKIEYSTAEKITKLEKQGYEFVSDDFTNGGEKVYDSIKDNVGEYPSQVFTVVVRPIIKTITPNTPEGETPKPGQPVNPDDPNSPNWPEDLKDKDLSTIKVVTREISYVNDKDEEVHEKFVDGVTFVREIKVNLVTGNVTYGDWKAENNDSVLDGQKLPVVNGYIVTSATNGDKDVEPNTTEKYVQVTGDSSNIVEKVVYTPIGKWIPEIPQGVEPVDPNPTDDKDPKDPVDYPNNPTDPTKPGDPTDETIPYVPGYTPQDPSGNPLTPKDPTDPTKGYNPPPVPANPKQDTNIPYVKDKETVDQKGSVKFIVTGTNEEKHNEPLTGKEGKKFGYDPTEKIKEYEQQGYTVTNRDSYDKEDTFDNIPDNSQDFVFVLTPRIEPVTPNGEKPVPNTPVDPNKPDGPKWPDTVKDLVLTKEVTRTISYIDNKGQEVAKTFSTTVTFEREAKVNLVDGKITYGDWKAKNSDSTLEGQTLPVVAGHQATTAIHNSTVVHPESTQEDVVVDENATNITEVVIYTPNTAPAEKASQLAIIKYVDETGTLVKEIKNSVDTVVGKEDEPIKYTTDAKKQELIDKGYEIVKDGFTIPGGRVFDGVEDVVGKDPSQTFEVVVRPKFSTITPKPEDPTNPLPNPNEPITPIEPGQPIDPKQPNGPKWPAGVTEKDLVKQVTRMIKYVYEEDGREADATRKETVTFTREATINHVTGEIVYGEWKVSHEVDSDKNKDGKWNEEASKLIKGYVADKAVVEEETPTENTADKTVVVTYKKLGSWIPKLPDGETPKDPIPYPNDPNGDPTIPGTPENSEEPIPYVPGYTPEDPEGNPLKPVDPENPSKGYIPPKLPMNPSENIEIPYRPNSEEEKPNMPKPDKPAPEKPKPDMPKPDKPAPEKPKPDMPKPDRPTPEKPKSDMPKPNKPTSENPSPNKPASQNLPHTGEQGQDTMFYGATVFGLGMMIAALRKRLEEETE
ncbi:hypothetical protein KG091_07560 [Carnobacteriaceae bacterium zg-ZUI78]|nr:hypothetical protein [Carnobacteriaceae bacterium zg-ZUI78]